MLEKWDKKYVWHLLSRVSFRALYNLVRFFQSDDELLAHDVQRDSRVFFYAPRGC